MHRGIRIAVWVAVFGIVVLFFVLDPSENIIFPQCPFHMLTGYYCPGCGSQRAVHSLLHLDFAGVADNNVLFLPAVLVVFYHYTRPLTGRLTGKNMPDIFYSPGFPWIVLGILIVFWILRNIPFYPFLFLAPG